MGPPLENLGDQDVTARLWQDPFAPVWDQELQARNATSNANSTSSATAHGHQRIVEAIQKQLDLCAANNVGSSPPKIMILPVMVDGSPYPDKTEQRLRARQAVVQALGVSGFVPKNGERIGYFKIPWPKLDDLQAVSTSQQKFTVASWINGLTAQPRSTGDTADRELVVPFEWFQAQFDNPKFVQPPDVLQVLVLWLRDEACGDRPLARLGWLLDTLQVGGSPSPLLLAKVLGPRNSTTLRAMVLEAGRMIADTSQPDELKQRVRAQLQNVTFYSATPTAADTVLTSNAVTTEDQARLIKWIDNRNGNANSVADVVENALHPDSNLSELSLMDGRRHFFRTIVTDDVVASEMVKELGRRHIDVKSDHDDVAVVAEQDTFYGRALPLSFRAAATPEIAINELITSGSEQTPWIHSYSYLRGIDGKVPGEIPKQLEKQSGKTTDAQQQATSIRPSEQTEGLNQSDYLRRLATRLEALDRDLKNEGRGGLKAVGVLGSDVYDKLLVLRALRQRLPAAVFFTNNLDARFAHPDEWTATHNLVVVSSHGLALAPRIQASVPPFRDNYQTSIYASTLMATTFTGLVDEATKSPRIFEIGRSGPVDLSGGGGAFHPVPPTLGQWWSQTRIWAAAGLVFIVAILLAGIMKLHGRMKSKMPVSTPMALVAFSVGSAGAVGLSLVLQAYLQGREGEPFAWFDGVSIWPSVALQILTGWLACYFIRKAFVLMQHDAVELSGEFLLPLSPNGVNCKVHSRKTVQSPDSPTGGSQNLLTDEAVGQAISALNAAKKQQPATSGMFARNQQKEGAEALDPMTAAANATSPLPPTVRTGTVAAAAEKASSPESQTAVAEAEATPRLKALEQLPAPEINEQNWPDNSPEPAPIQEFELREQSSPDNKPEPEIEAPVGSEAPAVPQQLGDDWKGIMARLVRFRVVRLCVDNSLSNWAVGKENSSSACEIWKTYQRYGAGKSRSLRVTMLSVLFVGAGLLVLALYGIPRVPFRGTFGAVVGWTALSFALLGVIALTFVVMDATRVSERFIRHLSEGKTAWDPRAIEKFSSRWHVGDEELAQRLNIELIARRTGVISRLIYYPFLILSLFILSRLAYFDDFDWPAGLVIVLLANSALAVGATWILRRAAEHARTNALRHLREYHRGAGSLDAGTKSLIDEIEASSCGAFAPLSRHPLLGAILLPSGGLGIWAIVEYVTKTL